MPLLIMSDINYNSAKVMNTTKIILLALGAFFLWLVLIRIFRKLHRFPAPAFMGRFLDSDLRRWLQPPDQLIARSGIKPGMIVMDLGCGSGAFAPSVARAVGESGKVYAVDIQPAMLKQLERKLSRAENRNIRNIELKQAGAYDLPFADGSLDLVYMVTVLQEVPDRGRALRETKRILKTGGILALTEILLDPDYPLRSKTIKLGQGEGFMLDGNQGNLWNYTVRFKKPPSS